MSSIVKFRVRLAALRSRAGGGRLWDHSQAHGWKSGVDTLRSRSEATAGAFTRTRSALDVDSVGRSIGLLAVAALLVAAWSAWAFLAQITLYETSDIARLETDREAHVVQVPVDGRIVSTTLALGRRVNAGDELLRVEVDAHEIAQREAHARVGAMTAELGGLRNEIHLTEQAGRDEQRATTAAIDVARSQVREIEAPAAFAEAEANRLARLSAAGLVAESQLARARSEAAGQRAAAESLQLTITRIEREQTTRDRERLARLQQLRDNAARLERDMASSRAAIDRSQYEIDRRVVRAAVSGELGQVAVLKAGAFVKEGDTLASIVPPGLLRIVAEFQPAAAIGRIRPGQSARLRLHGFPWAQYGSIAARVERVGSEIRNGRVRVELALAGVSPSSIPLQHGLPGSVEIAVEHMTPAALAVRLAGQYLTTTRAASSLVPSPHPES